MRNSDGTRDVHQVLRSAAWWVADIVMVAVFAWFFVSYYGYRVEMDGRSMEPLLQNQDVVLLDRVCYNFHKPERFDVIAFVRPDENETLSVKRVIGLPGETVLIRDGEIYIDGERLDTGGRIAGIALAGLAEEPVQLAEDEYFVLGDRPDVSEDSRFASVGNIHSSQIRGKVWLRLEPFSSIRLID